MDKVLLVVGSIAIAGFVSMILGRRRVSPSATNAHHVPDRLDLDDFPEADGNWLVIVFSSSKCETCASVVTAIRQLAMPGLSTREITIERHGGIHDRYGIDGVPTTVIADPQGRVRKSFLGPVSRQTLTEAFDDATGATSSGDL